MIIEIPQALEEDVVTVNAMGAKMLGAIERLLASPELPGGTDGEIAQILLYSRNHLREALGFGEGPFAGLIDIIGMRIFENWADTAVVDGTYGGITVYRYDPDADYSLYSAKELIDKATGHSFWHRRVENLRTHLVSALGVSDKAPYVVRMD